MEYETGTANNVNDLLDKFRLFAAAQGWTTNRWTTVGSGGELCISKGSAYFNFRSWSNEAMLVNRTSSDNKYGITINGSDGYSAGNGVHASTPSPSALQHRSSLNAPTSALLAHNPTAISSQPARTTASIRMFHGSPRRAFGAVEPSITARGTCRQG